MDSEEISQEQLEAKLLALLLGGDQPVLAVLRKQAAVATVIQREFSGVGFFTTFAVPDGVPLANPPSFAGGDVNIQLEDVSHGAGCVLFVRDGKVEMLECYTHAGDQWPERIKLKSLSDAIPALPH